MIIPSIDLIDGKAVQLKQGREQVLERKYPEDLAREFARFGELAVIDLDAAFGKKDNEEVIRKICAIAECRVGGGIRDLEKAQRVLSLGAEKLIIGTKALSGKQVNHEFCKKYVTWPERSVSSSPWTLLMVKSLQEAGGIKQA